MAGVRRDVEATPWDAHISGSTRRRHVSTRVKFLFRSLVSYFGGKKECIEKKWTESTGFSYSASTMEVGPHHGPGSLERLEFVAVRRDSHKHNGHTISTLDRLGNAEHVGREYDDLDDHAGLQWNEGLLPTTT